MIMPHTISVCIITCDRPDLFGEAIQSCFAQDVAPDEIVVGDDSRSTATRDLVARLQSETAIRIAYRHNDPRLGQNVNINGVFQRATGSHLVLLHDDDVLLPNALRDLIACWEIHPDLTAAYGKQIMITHVGREDAAATEKLNVTYRRTPEHAGLQERPLDVGIAQQFPNDGYMVTARAAQQTLWRSREEVGYGGEYDFGLRLASSYVKFYFIDVFTAKYRMTQGGSISGSMTDDAALQSYRLLAALDVPAESAERKQTRLNELAPTAIAQALRFGKKREAWEMLASENFTWRQRASLGGMRKLLQLLIPCSSVPRNSTPARTRTT